MQVQQQAYLQHALNAFESGALQHALAYIAYLDGALAPNVWAQIAERLAAAPVHERFRHAWCARIADVPEPVRACAAARFLHTLWRITLMQVQGRALACPACRVRAAEHALEPRCDACRRIDAAFAVCDRCSFRHGPLCLLCDAAHPAAVPCADAARPSALSMGAGLYMPTYLAAALRAPTAAPRAYKRRPRETPPAIGAAQPRPFGTTLSRPDGAIQPRPTAGASRVSIILSRASPHAQFSLGTSRDPDQE